MATLNLLPKKKRNETPRRDDTVRRKERHEIYDTARWRKLRISKLMSQPLCEECLRNGRVTPATQVHHTVSFMKFEGMERLKYAYDYNNLMSLCTECHQLMHNPMKRYLDENDEELNDEQKELVRRNKEILEAGR